MKKYKLSKEFEIKIATHLKNLNVQLNDSKKIADAVLKMSNFYIQNPSSKTPWNESWCQIAQLSYYLPLNYLRAQNVVEEGHRVSFFEDFEACVEVGVGLGALTFHLQEIFKNIEGMEISSVSQKIFSQMTSTPMKFSTSLNLAPKSLLSFSYSLTEAISISNLKKAQGLLIIEPSTHQDARQLQVLRQQLLNEGFYAWAPCTHQGQCPLLLHSQKDWCHHRIHVEMPEWFLEIERYLPFKNRTLTFSYLLMSKQCPQVSLPQMQKARVIGDILEERGKTKALICRGEEREFFSILHKDSKVFPYERGDIALLSGEVEKKGNEIRIKREEQR